MRWICPRSTAKRRRIGPFGCHFAKNPSAMSRATPLEYFREACGLTRPICLTFQEPDSPDVAPVPLDDSRPFLLVGRHLMADVSVNHPLVSRRHAYLQAVAGGVVCVDLNSRTKTRWDSEESPRAWGWLDPGRSIRIGPYEVHRSDDPFGPSPVVDSLDPFSSQEEVRSDSLPRPAFKLPFRVGGISATWDMRGLLAIIGQSEDCQFVLTDNSISQYHACLVRTPLGVWVVDLAAREGVHVNGTRVRWAWLADGDLLRFGLLTIVVRYEQPPEGIVREDVPLEAGTRPTGRLAVNAESTAGAGDRDRRVLALRSKTQPNELMRARGPRHGVLSVSPAPVNRGEWEPMIASGPSPFAMWQQQMQLMETFHNDMAMMVQMFVAMHREFQASVRGELDRVQKLTRELGRLNERLRKLPQPAGPAPQSEASRPTQKVPSSPNEDRPAPDAIRRTHTARRAVEPTGRPPKDRPRHSGENGRPAPAADDQASAAPADPKQATSETYADLTRRISELQHKRRGYWERILKTLGG
jgi:pSer/pThr/pTyr-binding forkhead associated (FHA) protein